MSKPPHPRTFSVSSPNRSLAFLLITLPFLLAGLISSAGEVASFPTRTPVFVGGQDGYRIYRIPALVTTSKGTLIAVADGRSGNDIPDPLDLVVRRSFDKGSTWQPVQVIASYGTDTSAADVDSYPYYNLTNVQRVACGDAALLLDRTNGRVWVFYDNGAYVKGLNYNRAIKLEMRYSDDDGASWSGRIDVEASNPGLRPNAAEFLVGPGNGIQLTGGRNQGRLIFPVYAQGRTNYSSLIYSDDHGQTWKNGGIAGALGGEIQIAEAADGSLIATMRNAGFPEKGRRHFSRSTDGGLTWSAPYNDTGVPPFIADPRNQASILRLDTPAGVQILHANTDSPTNRVRMMLRASADGGRTWPGAKLICPGSAAYSALAPLPNGEIGLLFESDNYTRIDFVRANIEELR